MNNIYFGELRYQLLVYLNVDNIEPSMRLQQPHRSTAPDILKKAYHEKDRAHKQTAVSRFLKATPNLLWGHSLQRLYGNIHFIWPNPQ